MKLLAYRLVLMLAVAGAVLVLAMTVAHPAAATRAPMPPTSATKAGAAARRRVKSIGTFSSVRQATLAFQASGRVKEIDVKEGAPVRAGDVIASLDTSTLELQVAQAQAKYDQFKNPPAADVAIGDVHRTFRGLVVDTGSATTEATSVATPAIDNSSDTKKVPVKIAFDYARARLVPGMSATLTIYTR